MKKNLKTFPVTLLVYIPIFLSLFMVYSPVSAQKKVVIKGGKEVEPTSDGGKYVRETYPEDDLWVYKTSRINSSNVTIKEKYYKNNDKEAGNNKYYVVIEEHDYDCKGRIIRYWQVIKDENGQQSIDISFHYNSDQDYRPKVLSGWKTIKAKNGDTKAYRRRKDTIDDYRYDRPEYWIDCDYSDVRPVTQPDSAPCSGNSQNCKSAFNFFAAPGAMMVDYGSEKKLLPGGQVAAKFNLTSRISIGGGAGFYSSEVGKIKFNRKLFLIDGQYSFTDLSDCDRTWIQDIHITSGLVIEKFGMAKGKGIIFGGGAGVTRMISDRAGIKVQGDLFGLKWENADNINIDYRISIGAEIHLGKKSSGIMKYPILRLKK